MAQGSYSPLHGVALVSFDQVVAAVAADAGVEPAMLLGRGKRGDRNGANFARQRLLVLLRRLRPDLSWEWLRLKFDRAETSALCCAKRTGERRLADAPEERETCERIAAALGYNALPDHPATVELLAVDRRIQTLNGRLRRLQTRRQALVQRMVA